MLHEWICQAHGRRMSLICEWNNPFHYKIKNYKKNPKENIFINELSSGKNIINIYLYLDLKGLICH